jgi:hypothetical protein
VSDAPLEPFDRVRAAMATFRVQETTAIAAARAYGIDIGLLKESMLRTPLERVQRNDEILATLSKDASQPVSLPNSDAERTNRIQASGRSSEGPRTSRRARSATGPLGTATCGTRPHVGAAPVTSCRPVQKGARRSVKL